MTNFKQCLPQSPKLLTINPVKKTETERLVLVKSSDRLVESKEKRKTFDKMQHVKFHELRP